MKFNAVMLAWVSNGILNTIMIFMGIPAWVIMISLWFAIAVIVVCELQIKDLREFREKVAEMVSQKSQ